MISHCHCFLLAGFVSCHFYSCTEVRYLLNLLYCACFEASLGSSLFCKHTFRVMAGPIHEPHLRGNLVDIEKQNNDGKKEPKPVAFTPEGFPNSFVRGASGLYMRVGLYIENMDDGSTSQSSSAAASQSAAAVKGIHLHIIAEPAVPKGGSLFGGPVILRVIENEGK